MDIQSAGGFLLDEYPGALAAYSLRRLSPTYSGSAIRVRRSTDGAESDFGFAGEDLDVAGIETWLSGADGEVVKWYSQIKGHPPLVPHGGLLGPMIAEAGDVVLDEKGLPRLKFFRLDGLITGSPGLPGSISQDAFSLSLLYETDESTPETAAVIQVGANNWESTTFTIQGYSPTHYWVSGAGTGFGDVTHINVSTPRTMLSVTLSGSEIHLYDRHEPLATAPVTTTAYSFNSFTVGAPSRLREGDGDWTGYVSEIVFYPLSSFENEVQLRYDNANAYWGLGPAQYNQNALLPQQYAYQVDLYNWLKTIKISEVTLPPATFSWDGSLADVDELADLWLQLEGITVSSVVRGEPEWYTLDAGNGLGIEATGTVRLWNEPKGDNPFGSGYGGNPARSWSNEPAFLYQLHVPRLDGSEGNPYYHDPALGRRALVIAAVDMMMYHQEMLKGGYASWTDMFGKALLSWAETYRWCGEILDPVTARAFEEGFGYFLDKIIDQGARAVNTNMDMFPMQAAAEIFMATDDVALKTKALQAVKRTLFGYPDGKLGVKHRVFATEKYKNGVFGPAGYIMEGDQPDVFYQGESIYHLMGALAAVTDRETGNVHPDWAFLDEVVGRIMEWEAYQIFYDPGGNAPEKGGLTNHHYYHAGAGFAGRTGASVPAGQAGKSWKFFSLADRYSAARYRAEGIASLSRSRMESAVADRLGKVNTAVSTEYVGTPPEWNGWSPWTKATPYLPPKGWYSRLKALYDTADPTREPFVDQEGVHYNKTFGGYPTGDEYWAYKNTDGTREWGFFVEAQARQGGYGGWYGGKIETFWTESTGVVLLNRHGKTGCNAGDKEDSSCFDDLDYKAAHHVWGLDENGGSFTTLLLRGQDLRRTAAFDTRTSIPSVSVTNVFNDPSIGLTSNQSGEQSGSELQGRVEVTNTFEALANGVRVTHTIGSDETDDVKELWVSLPVFLRMYDDLKEGDKPQRNFNDTSIEYWNGSAWVSMPEDKNGDGVPEFVNTTALRLGRDYMRGDGPQYVYVTLDASRKVRLAKKIYQDPYQTVARVRTVHIDLHGNPGVAKKLPASLSLSYAITTTETAQEPVPPVSSEMSQRIPLQAGWNIVSRAVNPADAGMEATLSGIASDVVMVKDERGRIYSPEMGINTIGTWEVDEAYMVYARGNTTLDLRGALLDPASTPIALTGGWNMVPYVGSETIDVATAFEGIEQSLVIVKDNFGGVYYPSLGIDTIGELVPGQGYKLYLDEDASLTYPPGAAALAGSPQGSNLHPSITFGGP